MNRELSGRLFVVTLVILIVVVVVFYVMYNGDHVDAWMWQKIRRMTY